MSIVYQCDRCTKDGITTVRALQMISVNIPLTDPAETQTKQETQVDIAFSFSKDLCPTCQVFAILETLPTLLTLNSTEPLKAHLTRIQAMRDKIDALLGSLK